MIAINQTAMSGERGRLGKVRKVVIVFLFVSNKKNCLYKNSRRPSNNAAVQHWL